MTDGGFPLSHNLFLCTHVSFTHVNKTETMYGRSRVNVNGIWADHANQEHINKLPLVWQFALTACQAPYFWMQNSTAARHKYWLQFYLSELFQYALQMLPHLNKMTRVQYNGIFHWWRDSSPKTSGFSNILALRTQRQILIVITLLEHVVLSRVHTYMQPTVNYLTYKWYTIYCCIFSDDKHFVVVPKQ